MVERQGRKQGPEEEKRLDDNCNTMYDPCENQLRSVGKCRIPTRQFRLGGDDDVGIAMSDSLFSQSDSTVYFDRFRPEIPPIRAVVESLAHQTYAAHVRRRFLQPNCPAQTGFFRLDREGESASMSPPDTLRGRTDGR